MVIEEVSAIQENLEIERTCRESAEALASKVHFIFKQLLSTILLKVFCQIIRVNSMLRTLPKEAWIQTCSQPRKWYHLI